MIAPFPRGRAAKVLLGHDFAEVRAIYARDLEEAGFEVITAIDAPAVIDSALKHHPAVIIIDDGLPELTGWDVVRLLKSHPPFQITRILMLTGLFSESRRAAEAAGVDAVIPKPCDGQELVSAVRRVLRKNG